MPYNGDASRHGVRAVAFDYYFTLAEGVAADGTLWRPDHTITTLAELPELVDLLL